MRARIPAYGLSSIPRAMWLLTGILPTPRLSTSPWKFTTLPSSSEACSPRQQSLVLAPANTRLFMPMRVPPSKNLRLLWPRSAQPFPRLRRAMYLPITLLTRLLILSPMLLTTTTRTMVGAETLLLSRAMAMQSSTTRTSTTIRRRRMWPTVCMPLR